MRPIRAIWRFLSHPALSAAGNVSFLVASIPFTLVIAGGVVSWILDQPTLSLVAIGLGVLGLLWLGVGAVQQRLSVTAESSTPSAEQVPLDKAQPQRTPTFIAAEAEIALAREEALEMAKMLRKDWPHLTPDSAVVEVALPDWRSRTTEFIGVVLGPGRRAAFKAATTGGGALEHLEAEGGFLDNLALELAPDSIRVSEDEFLTARRQRRDHEAASFLGYNHERTPGAPPKATAPEKQALIENLQFPVRNDRLELAERCEAFALGMEKWIRRNESEREQIIEKNSAEIAKADSELDPDEARRDAESHYERVKETEYAIHLRSDAVKLFDEAHEMEVIGTKSRHLAKRPHAFEFAEVPNLFAVIGKRLREETPNRGTQRDSAPEN